MAQLTFTDVDGITFAASRGRLPSIESSMQLTAHNLGPLLELYHFSIENLIPQIDKLPWLSCSDLAPLGNAMIGRRNCWVSPDGGTIGFLKPSNRNGERDWNAFAIAAHKASLGAGIQSRVTAQLVGALGEMRSNIYEHSEAIESGLIAFCARPNSFEFTVADHGIGVLQSLRSCGHYASVTDNGEALRLILTENVSRFRPSSKSRERLPALIYWAR